MAYNKHLWVAPDVRATVSPFPDVWYFSFINGRAWCLSPKFGSAAGQQGTL